MKYLFTFIFSIFILTGCQNLTELPENQTTSEEAISKTTKNEEKNENSQFINISSKNVEVDNSGNKNNKNSINKAFGTISNNTQDSSHDPNEEMSQNSKSENGGLDSVEDRIKLTFNNQEVFVKMFDNPASRDFLTKLPLTLTLEDYARIEKISYLPEKLSIEEAPSGIDPEVGDFTYYAPWGNLAIFYNDFGYSNGLVLLGKIESGIEKLASMSSNFNIKIEKVTE